ncbi:MAG: 50S ribosomal protein L30 [Peptococcaceae bacterium]|jgi:large subunit ribosomal protein L30|nr:50S ribosomal protein L30 [Peptococcaceae bacterium]
MTEANVNTVGKVKITLVKSVIGYNHDVRETVKSLGLRKINSSAVQAKTPDILGKIRRVSHLVAVEDLD